MSVLNGLNPIQGDSAWADVEWVTFRCFWTVHYCHTYWPTLLPCEWGSGGQVAIQNHGERLFRLVQSVLHWVLCSMVFIVHPFPSSMFLAWGLVEVYQSMPTQKEACDMLYKDMDPLNSKMNPNVAIPTRCCLIVSKVVLLFQQLGLIVELHICIILERGLKTNLSLGGPTQAAFDTLQLRPATSFQSPDARFNCLGGIPCEYRKAPLQLSFALILWL